MSENIEKKKTTEDKILEVIIAAMFIVTRDGIDPKVNIKEESYKMYWGINFDEKPGVVSYNFFHAAADKAFSTVMEIIKEQK